ncbi:MAG: UTP--glucose-1-phosphate uridylyltransferase [Pirellulales bacterium]|nr:UTP--glucose-1-phosphate uridylyltransferase [Pirellulales bacterium]
MKESLLAQLKPFGQEHLLAFWDRLDKAGRTELARQIEALDMPLVQRLYERRNNRSDFRALADRASPPPAIRRNGANNPFTPEQARAQGAAALAAGQIGTILVAGGQGTRLGFPHPKGMYPIGPVSKRTLFEILVGKIGAAARRYGVRIPLYLMTSPATDAETRAFFREQRRFGLPEEDLFVFCQGTMPALDEATGKILLETPGRLALSPDGHGGMLAALARSGALDDLESRGIRHLFYFQVDNPLVEVCGPEFLGYHLLAGSEFTPQVIAKQDPLARLGVVVQVDGRLQVIEYSDLHEDAARRRNADGTLTHWAGSPAIHAISAVLLRRLAGSAEGLPFHYARKKVPYVDAAGRQITPGEPNALKFERFIFDLLPAARNALVVEIDPAEGFAPLKNAPGAVEDTEEMVQKMMIAQHRRWLERAGADVAEGAAVEISPLYALDAEGLKRKIAAGLRITEPTYLRE